MRLSERAPGILEWTTGSFANRQRASEIGSSAHQNQFPVLCQKKISVTADLDHAHGI